jgi:hypothetical protein
MSDTNIIIDTIAAMVPIIFSFFFKIFCMFFWI